MNTLAPSFLSESSSYLQETRTTIISQTSSNLSQIRPRTVELAALEHLEKSPLKSCEHSSSFIFDSIILIVAGNEDMHESLDEFKFRSDTTYDFRVICPCTSEKLTYNVVNTLAPLFLIRSSSYLQVTRTSIHLGRVRNSARSDQGLRS